MGIVEVVLLAAGLVALAWIGAAAYITRLSVFPPRQPLWQDPSALGIPFEDVTFYSKDGVRLSGWFLPPPGVRGAPSPGIVMVHGWPWNRLGTQGRRFRDLPRARSVDVLPLAAALHQAGYAVLMFDLRNHGASQASRPMSMGWMEAQDVAAAGEVLASRPEVDEERVGVIGFSLGGNSVLYALPLGRRFRAAIAIQPMTANVFAAGFGADLLGRLWRLVDPLSRLFFRLAGGFQLSYIDPVLIAPGFSIPVLFVQGAGDKWGSVANVAAMARACPIRIEPIFPETDERYGGYHYVLDNPDLVLGFFKEHVAGAR